MVTSHQPWVKWALHKNIQVSQSPVTGYPATGHWTQGEVNIRWSTGHQSPVIRLYISLHLVSLMPWAWSSLIITQKEFYYPWNWTLVMSDPSVVIKPPDNN